MNNQKMVELLDIREWEWSDFKLVYDTVSPMMGEEETWRMIHTLWQIRSEEVFLTQEKENPAQSITQLINGVPGLEKVVPIEKLDWNISRMYISVRTFNALSRAGINTVRDVYNLPSFHALSDIKNLGLKSREEVIFAMRQMGFIGWVDRICFKKGRIYSDE